MRVMAFLTQGATVAKILDHLGLPSRAPPIRPARPPPLELDFAGWADESFADPPATDQA